MSQELSLRKPWLIAVWPGMGNVALSAGYYLMAKLGMHFLGEYPTGELFDVDHVDVKGGLIRGGRRPRSRFFLWTDPNQRHDLVVLVGEAQPAVGKYAFCQELIKYAERLGVERILTFAAMITQMHPQHRSRVFGAATDARSLKELKRLDLEILEEGHISGLNGVLLGAAESGLRGACLLGETPHLFAQIPFPKASLAVLEVFTSMAGIELDLTELSQQVRAMEHKLGELMSKVERAFEPPEQADEEAYRPESADEGPLSPEDEQRIEHLFEQAKKDRSKAYELKGELDRLDVFKEYEDRFLDLFKRSG